MRDVEIRKELTNFIEVAAVEDANHVDLGDYTFIGLKENKYCFKIRQR